MKSKLLATKEQFEAFKDVRDSGLTNMWMSRSVIELSGDVLTKETHIDIIKNWDEYVKAYENKN